MLRRGRDASTGGAAVFLLLCFSGPCSRAPTDFDHELAEIHFVLVKPIWGEAVSLHTVQLAEARRQTDDALIAGGPQGPCGTEKGQHPFPPSPAAPPSREQRPRPATCSPLLTGAPLA